MPEIVSKLQRNKPTQSQIFNQTKLGFRVLKGFFGCEVLVTKGNTFITQIGTKSQVNKTWDA